MGTTRAVLRQRFLEQINDRIATTCTSQGAAAGASLISTNLQAWDGAKDDYYNNRWVLLTDGSYSGNERYVSDYAQSTGTITPRPNFGGQLANATAFEVMRWEPAMIHAALLAAARQSFPYLYREVIEEVIAGNHLWNGSFEDYATANVPDHWASSGTPTLTEETTTIYGMRGTSALKMNGGTTAYVYQSTAQNPSLLDLAGQSCTFYARVSVNTASKAFLRIYTKTEAGTTATTDSSYHSGGSEYESLSVTATIPQTASDIEFRIYSGDVAACYIDNTEVQSGDLYRVHVPLAFTLGPDQIYLQRTGSARARPADAINGTSRWERLHNWHIENDGSDRMIVFDRPPTAGYKLRLRGMEELTQVSSDTATMEVAGQQVDALVAVAAQVMLEKLGNTETREDLAPYIERMRYWAARAPDMLRLHQMKRVPESVEW